MRFSVFGGTGFVGSYFVRLTDSIVEPRDSYIPERPNVVSFVSTVDNYNVFTDPTKDIVTNELFTIRLLDSAYKKFGKDLVFNYISSWFVYGDVNIPASESSHCRPAGMYGISKLATEELVKSYCGTFNIPYRILRLPNCIGVGDRGASLKKNAITYIISELARNNPAVIYDEHHLREVMDVRDVASAIELVMRLGETNQIYNIGRGVGVNVGEIFEEVSKILGVEIPTKPVPEFHKKVQFRDFFMDVTKLSSLGFVPKYSLLETIQWIINEAKSN